METEDKYTRITLRIPKDLHARLSEEAEATSKSMNAEIVARLESSFEEMDLNQSIQLLIDELMKAGHRIDALERELSEARHRLDRFTQADKPLAELLREVLREELSRQRIY